MTIIRPATASDGPAIKGLMDAMGTSTSNIDWGNIGDMPSWLVAEDDGKIVGCVQAVVALPLGYISNLVVQEDRRGGRLKLRISLVALRSLRGCGCQYAFGFVPSHLTKWKKALAKIGATEGADGALFSLSLRD